MYIKAKMMPVEAILGIRGWGGDKGEQWRG
jgi:hypothetical protein